MAAGPFEWQYEPASDLAEPTIERLRRFPREPDMLVYGLRVAAALLCRGWVRSITGWRSAAVTTCHRKALS